MFHRFMKVLFLIQRSGIAANGGCCNLPLSHGHQSTFNTCNIAGNIQALRGSLHVLIVKWDMSAQFLYIYERTAGHRS
ncbi:hypothetical protein D3C72_1263740 [compost metagenome]